jgi:hypothetical protein
MERTAYALLTYFAVLEDPRAERTEPHPLENVVTMAIWAVIGERDELG